MREVPIITITTIAEEAGSSPEGEAVMEKAGSAFSPLWPALGRVLAVAAMSVMVDEEQAADVPLPLAARSDNYSRGTAVMS
jgi:hypothetical protein